MVPILLGSYEKKSDLHENKIHCRLGGMDMEQKIWNS